MAGTPSKVQLQPESTGPKIATFEKVIGSNTVELQAVVLTDSDGNELTTIPVSMAAPPTGAATAANQTTEIAGIAAILAKILAAPATEAKQDTQITAEQAILTKLIAAPATEAKQPSLGTATAPSANVLTVQRPSVTQVVSTALEASHVLKASAGQLVQLSIFNSNASAQFILLINATSLPGNGAVTLLYPPIPIAGATLLVLDLPAPLVASTGIVVCNSSTGSFTKTIGAADCVFYAQVN